MKKTLPLFHLRPEFSGSTLYAGYFQQVLHITSNMSKTLFWSKYCKRKFLGKNLLF